MLTVSDLNDLIEYKDNLESKLNKIKDDISSENAMNVVRNVFNRLNDSEILSTTTLNKKLHYFNDTYMNPSLQGGWYRKYMSREELANKMN